MKLLPTILSGAIAALLSQSAFADVTVRITGSTAYRPSVHKAIVNLLNGGAVSAAYSGSNLSGAGKAWFRGTISGHAELGTVTVKTSWSGSAAGVQTVSNSLNVSFLPDTVSASSAASVSGGAASGGTAISDATVSEKAEVAMSDTYQNSTSFNTTTLTDIVVGVVPFKWVASKGAPASLTNITPQLAQALWGNGTLPLALFTGNPADEGSTVYATGRDPDSGTRLTAFAESGIGVNATVTQYKPTIASGAVTAYAPYPQQTVNGITFPQGQGGEASGGTLAGNMAATTTAATGYSITYLSTGDAATAISGGAKELAYNGVTYSLTSVQEGLYTFWGYEHLMYRTTLTGDAKTTADLLASQILNTDATVLYSSMHCVRPTDGGQVTPNY